MVEMHQAQEPVHVLANSIVDAFVDNTERLLE
jgi:hypothetical protein